MTSLVDPVENCDCCGTAAEDMAIDDLSGLCLYCQPCGYCGRMGTACDDSRGPGSCDLVEYPDRPRRDVNEVMAEISAVRRERLRRVNPVAPVTNEPVPHTTSP